MFIKASIIYQNVTSEVIIGNLETHKKNIFNLIKGINAHLGDIIEQKGTCLNSATRFGGVEHKDILSFPK